MKQYTDQGKVDTRSGFGAGRLGCRVLLLSIILIFVSCFEINSDYKPLPYFHVYFTIDGIAYEYDFYDKPSVFRQETDSFSEFSLRQDNRHSYSLQVFNTDCPLVINLQAISDADCFVEGKKYDIKLLDARYPAFRYTTPLLDEGLLSFTLQSDSDSAIAYGVDLDLAVNYYKTEDEYYHTGPDNHMQISMHIDIYKKYHQLRYVSNLIAINKVD